MSQLYQQAADVLQAVAEKRKGLKSAVYADGVTNKVFACGDPGVALLSRWCFVGLQSQSYALVCETLKYKSVIDEVLDLAGMKTLAKVAEGAVPRVANS